MSQCNKRELPQHLVFLPAKETAFHFVTSKSHRFGIEVDNEKPEVQIFSIADYMDQARGMLMDVLKYERRWISNKCMKKCLFSSVEVFI